MAQTKAHIDANARYNKKTYDRIALNLRRDSEMNADYIRNYAAAHGESVNSFLMRAIQETIHRDSLKNKAQS